MLRITTYTADAAKRYFGSLSRADGSYYIEGSELDGVWGGKGAEMLGLSGPVKQKDYNALLDNLHPETGEQLTPRVRADRRSMADFTVSVHKAVSALHAVGGDQATKDVNEVVPEAMADLMKQIEADAATRVRRNGKNHDRTTGNLVWATFVHYSARPVNGVVDPHLHAHICVMNQTFDPVEKRWKAAQLGAIMRDAPFFQAYFDACVARGLEARGYEIQGDDKSWRIVGVPDSLTRKFSRRTQLIEKTAAALGITDPEKKAELGQRTREPKGQTPSFAELQGQWRQRLTHEERDALAALSARVPRAAERPSKARDESILRQVPERSQSDEKEVPPAPPVPAKEDRRISSEDRSPETEKPERPAALDRSTRRVIDAVVKSLLERESVVPELKLIHAALIQNPGKVTVAQVRVRLDEREDLIRREHGGIRQVTTRAALDEERLMVKLARDGRGQCDAMSRKQWEIRDESLNPAQRAAVRHVLASTDRVTVMHGGTATGRVPVLEETVRAVEKCGHIARVFAPSADAARGLFRDSGFKQADTLSRLLSDKDHPARSRDTVWFIGDAHQLGNKQMTELLTLAKECRSRVVLLGDVREHQAFGRGDALRVLINHAGLKPAGLSELFRQRGRYREAAEALSVGLVERAVEELSKVESFRARKLQEGRAELAQEFVSALKRGRTALAVAPTRTEREKVTDAIRTELKREGVLGKAQRLTTLTPAGLTEAERSDASKYEAGMVIQFMRGVKGLPKLRWNGFRAGERVTVLGRDPFGNVAVSGGGQVRTLPLRHADRFEVFRKSETEIAVGDTIRITRSGYFGGEPQRPKWDRNPIIDKLNVRYARKQNAKRLLDNGALLRVKGFTRNGDIKVEGSRVIPRDYAHIEHGYCLSPHAARTRTVREVFVSMPAYSTGPGSVEQLRTAMNCGRDRVTVFTDDKDDFVKRAAERPDRPSATRVAEHGRSGVSRNDAKATLERARLNREVNEWMRESQKRSKLKLREHEHER